MAADGAKRKRRKELRVKIPVGHHLKLRSLKLLRGKNMADTVQEALRLYFERMEHDERLSSAGRLVEGQG